MTAAKSHPDHSGSYKMPRAARRTDARTERDEGATDEMLLARAGRARTSRCVDSSKSRDDRCAYAGASAPLSQRLREPTLGEHATSAPTWGGLLCERAHTRGKSEFLGRLIREMEARKEGRSAAVGGGGICRRRTNKGQLNQPTDLSLPLFLLQPNCYSLTMRMNSRRGIAAGRTVFGPPKTPTLKRVLHPRFGGRQRVSHSQRSRNFAPPLL